MYVCLRVIVNVEEEEINQVLLKLLSPELLLVVGSLERVLSPVNQNCFGYPNNDGRPGIHHGNHNISIQPLSNVFNLFEDTDHTPDIFYIPSYRLLACRHANE